LPEAHVEAPTVGSIILAALLLKLGSYGFYRILLEFLLEGSRYYSPLFFTLSFLGLFYSSIILLRQYDFKKIIAYSSIAHMNFGLLGMFSNNIEGICGSFLLMLSHGFSSGTLFYLIGLLYLRFLTKNIYYYSGMIYIMPIFTIIFFITIISNFGFPGTFNFISEFLVLLGLYHCSFDFALFSGIGIFFSVVYSMFLYNKLFMGEIRILTLHYKKHMDLS